MLPMTDNSFLVPFFKKGTASFARCRVADRPVLN
jgi:hypothetical protein